MANYTKSVLKLVLIFLVILLFESCEKDPIQQSKSEFFKKLNGTWILSDYKLSMNSYYSNASQNRRTWFFNNTITDTMINCQYPSCDTTFSSYSYFKQLYFVKYKKDILYYADLTILAGATIVKEYSLNWTKLTIDSLVINIDDIDYKIELDSENNLVINYKDHLYSAGSGYNKSKMYLFRKL